MSSEDGAGTAAAGATGRNLDARLVAQEMLGRFGVLLGLIVLIIVFSILSPIFLSQGNITNILIQSSTNAIIAAGMTFVILSANIDLSVGSVLALSSVLGTAYIADGGPIVIGVGIMLLGGMVAGAINGFTVGYLGFPAFIVTLATMWLFRGSAYVFTNGQAVTGLPRDFRILATGEVAGIPYIVVVMALVYAVCYFVLSRTTFGRQVYAVGDNKEAARLSGVNVKRITAVVFIISGFMAALGGVVLSSRLFSGQPVAGITFELSAIAAVVIGGTSLFGGKGGILGTLVGAIFIATLINGLVILNVSSFWQQVIMGLVVLAAVGIDQYRKRLAAGRA
ncbi:MAG: ABC transporter permease [Chloroflexota bacterium]|jgi:ribose transport system permease protein